METEVKVIEPKLSAEIFKKTPQEKEILKKAKADYKKSLKKNPDMFFMSTNFALVSPAPPSSPIASYSGDSSMPSLKVLS